MSKLGWKESLGVDELEMARALHEESLVPGKPLPEGLFKTRQRRTLRKNSLEGQ
jgi:hypothetical protein